MVAAVKEAGGLDVQLVYFRGFGETRASQWVSDPDALARLMTRVSCQGGYTQIRKVLTHARRESERNKVNAVVYVGDCMEEDIDELCQRAGALGLLGTPMFLFQEGRDQKAERAFKEIARLTRGAYCHFDAGSARQLRQLLAAVAVYAAGGHKALRDYGKATNSDANFGPRLGLPIGPWVITTGAFGPKRKTPGQKSGVRTDALEMVLDHDSGQMEGSCLKGRDSGERSMPCV